MDERKPVATTWRIPNWVDWLGGVITRNPRLSVKLGELESRVLRDELGAIAIRQPIYVAGLARSGSTLLLEMLARHRGVVTHRYRDYPPLLTQYWWNFLLDRIPRKDTPAVERSHADRILVTPESPEAMEETLWMALFPALHDPGVCSVLSVATENEAFERFYRDHIRKLLLARGGSRYASKGNYNVTRLDYILKLFPDARIVIPVRAPAAHIGSLMKQQALFCRMHAEEPRTLAHMQRLGHFEFGLDRRAVNVGCTKATLDVTAAWESGDEVLGWARYWSQIYGQVVKNMRANSTLRDAALVLRYEDLCEDPEGAIRILCDHCRLDDPGAIGSAFAGKIEVPKYYEPSFTAKELAVIEDETAENARQLGY